MLPLDSDSYGVDAEDIALYLSANLWTEKEIASPYLAVWSRLGDPKELFVPRIRDVADFDAQLAIIARYLSDLEGRPPQQVLSDMRYTGADIIRLRIDTPAVDRGTISFEKAADVLVQARSLLVASARAAVHPQSFYTARPSAEVSDYVNTTRLGQTEPGSFIFTIVSPITFARAARPSQDPVPLPFARRVTATLSKGLNAVRTAAAEIDRPMTAVFEELVDDGVSANFCDALSIIADQSFDNAVEVEFTWSSKIPTPTNERRSRVVVPPIITPSLHAMSDHLKAVAPEEGFRVMGRVERLSNQEASEGFDLALRANIQGRERLLALELTDDAREIASTAWKTHRTVVTVGTLDRRFRPYRLLRPEQFELVDEE